MDNSNRSMNRNDNDHLGVNKMGKNIRKSPLHQPNFTNTARQQPQPQVYNINKNDFRNIVQQLTGSPSQEPLPRPPQNSPKPPSMRLQKIRPPPLTPINRSNIPIHPQAPAQPPAAVPYGNHFVRPPTHFGQPLPTMFPPLTPSDSFWPNIGDSPVSAYMRYLQNSILDSGPRQPQSQPFPHSHPQFPGQFHTQPPLSGLLPNPAAPLLPSPRMNGPPPLPSLRMNGPPPPLPSPRGNGPPLLPSPTSQFLLPSPSGFLNLFSPRSPYPLLSPGYQQPPPLTPNFSFSPIAQSGILGSGPQPPPSPGYGFPLSPGFFHISSPRWREQ
ncbi:unnamed protein product [Ilex paraguariensis]|uniref:VQ domain-containing protein n=1 Tax=Ilex paraguariensis TaxID=185542 RepID=A0ABC8RYZ2_9AQUA